MAVQSIQELTERMHPADHMSMEQRICQAHRDLMDMDWALAKKTGKRVDGVSDPMVVLDTLGPRDSEGHSAMEQMLTFFSVPVMAMALQRFMWRGPRISEITAAVLLRVEDMRRRSEALDNPPDNAVWGTGWHKGEHDVFCLRCKRNVYSDYHSNICGDEEGWDDLARVQLAMESDDPDSILW